MPGKKFPGQYGNVTVTVKSVKIISVLPEEGVLTDLKAWEQGYVTLTPLRIDRTEREMLERMRDWKLSLG